MDKLNYENQGTNTYLVYQIGEDDIVDSMSLGMITNNQIAGLAPTVFMQMDTAKYIKYNVSAKITVKQFFTGPVNKRRLLGVFNGIVSAMLSAEDYMIDDRMILLDTDYIFADVSTCETVLICLPIQMNESSTELGAFFKKIMFNTQFDQTENCDYVARIMNHLNSTPVFSLSQFKSVLDELNVPIQSSPLNSTASEATLVQQKKINQSPVLHQPESNKQLPVMPIKTTVVQQPVPQPIGSQQPVVPIMKTPPVSNPSFKDMNAQGSVTDQQQESDDKKISLFYLLQHYNNENAAAYKAQKAAKKTGNSVQHSDVSANDKKKNTGKKEQTKHNSVSFAIPGQPVPVNQKQPPVQQPNQQPVQPVKPIQQPVQPIRHQPVTPMPVTPQQSVGQQPVIPRPAQPVSNMNFGETTVLGGGVAGETTVLNAGAASIKQITPHLIRVKNNENIPVNKPVFRIGKEKSYVDYFIADNTAISRSHANIITREEKYFVLDTNSTNHTFVNGQMIPSSTEVEITHGTKLRFANEDFEFQLY